MKPKNRQMPNIYYCVCACVCSFQHVFLDKHNPWTVRHKKFGNQFWVMTRIGMPLLMVMVSLVIVSDYFEFCFYCFFFFTFSLIFMLFIFFVVFVWIEINLAKYQHLSHKFSQTHKKNKNKNNKQKNMSEKKQFVGLRTGI